MKVKDTKISIFNFLIDFEHLTDSFEIYRDSGLKHTWISSPKWKISSNK